MRHLTILLALALCHTATAQTLIPVDPPENVGYLDLSTGTIHPFDQAPAFAGGGGNIYRNSCFAGNLVTLSNFETLFDVGRIPSRTSLGAKDAYRVTSFQVGYGTGEADPSLGGPGARILVDFYDHYQECTDSSLNPAPVASFDLASLPGSMNPPNIETKTLIVLIPAADQFCIIADGDGTFDADPTNDTFGFSLTMPNQIAVGGGFLLGYDQATCGIGDGTILGNPFVDGSGLGSPDSLWIEPLAPTCFDFGGAPYASPWMVLTANTVENCTPGAESFCVSVLDGGGCSPTVTTEGIARKTLGLGPFRITATGVLNQRPFAAFYGIKKAGAVLPFFNGFRCVKAPLIRHIPPSFTGGSTAGIDCTGTMVLNLNPRLVPSPFVNAGDTLFFQYFYRDIIGSAAVVTTHGVRAFVLP